MPFSHFRGGLKPPLPCTGGFTLNGFTVNGFIPPIDALRHGRSRKPFTICSCEKCVRKCCGICTYKSKDLNSPGINTYKKHGGGGGPPCLLYLLYLLCLPCLPCLTPPSADVSGTMRAVQTTNPCVIGHRTIGFLMQFFFQVPETHTKET